MMNTYLGNFSGSVKSWGCGVVLVLCVVGGLAACAPTVTSRGNMLTERMLQQVTPGISTRTDVLQILGSPTTIAPFNENTWYYMGQITEKRGIFDPSIESETVVVAEFDDAGTLTRIATLDPKRQNVPLSDRKTPSAGSELTAVEQFLGNLGRFNKNTGAGQASDR